MTQTGFDSNLLSGGQGRPTFGTAEALQTNFVKRSGYRMVVAAFGVFPNQLSRLHAGRTGGIKLGFHIGQEKNLFRR